MNWRPKSLSKWIEYRDHCIKIILDSCDNEESDHINIFEAGANAILEAKEKEGFNDSEFGKGLCDWLMNHYLVKTGNHYRILKEEMDCIRQGKIPDVTDDLQM